MNTKLYYNQIPSLTAVSLKSSKIKEDVFQHSVASERIRKLLSHWNKQHDYIGVSWDGIIKFHRKLTEATFNIAFESVGWYKYKSSTKKDDMDGKDWRLILTEYEPLVVVNCHSCINQHVWTLATTVFNSNEIDRSKLKIVSDKDPEICSLLWSIEVAKILETNGYKYPEAIADMKEKLAKRKKEIAK